jgi:hypothetical protein
MAHPTERKCLSCGELFRPDARNLCRQKFCSQPACRKASKAASQRAWLAQPQNQDYFRGPENVLRVRLWRASHPGYWRRPKGARRENARRADALQDRCPAQAIEMSPDVPNRQSTALQDLLRDQPAVLIGFIAQFTGTTQQDSIARSTRRLVELGQDILAGRSRDDTQAGALPGAAAHAARAVQLDRPAAGA